MKKIVLLLLCAGYSIFAADAPEEIPPFIDIPYFANLEALRAKKPTKLFTVVLTPATTLLDIQQEVHDKVGAGMLYFSDYKQPTFIPEPINDLDRKNVPLGKLIKTNFFEDEDIDEPLDAFFFWVPVSGDETKEQAKQPMHLNKKSMPQV